MHDAKLPGMWFGDATQHPFLRGLLQHLSRMLVGEEEVLGTEFQNVLIYSKVHQLTVDAYAVQHARAEHKDKSVCIHLAGLHLWLEQGVNSREVPPLLQRLASKIEQWPHFEPPARIGPLTVFDVASAGLPEEHMDCVRAWADQIWEGWRARHADVQALVERFL